MPEKRQGFISSPFFGKNTITCNIWAIFPGNRVESKVKGLEPKSNKSFHPNDSWFSILVTAFSSFVAIDHKRHFRKVSTSIFKFGCIFLVPRLHFWKRWVRFPDAEFIAKSIGTNLKSQKWKNKKLVCGF